MRRLSASSSASGYPIAVALGLLVLVLAATPASANEKTGLTKAADVFTKAGMNVFRRHEAPPEAMFRFYGSVLGFDRLGTHAVGNGGVTRFQVGSSELKFTGREVGRTYVAGGVREVTGARLLTFVYPDQASVEAMFRAAGLPLPQFRAEPGRTSALVQDPDGQWVELVIVPGQSSEFYDQLEVGLTVSDLEASRNFYRNFVGLEELQPVHDTVFNVMKYPFRHGNTTVSLRSFGAALPADTGSGGIQYLVSDAVAVDKLAKAHKVVIDQPLSILDGYNMYFLWVDDPDGITNYFAQPDAVPQ